MVQELNALEARREIARGRVRFCVWDGFDLSGEAVGRSVPAAPAAAVDVILRLAFKKRSP